MRETVIGIRREDKNEWERRVPLSPFHVAILVKDRGYRVIVQPSDIRCFTHDEYLAAGAEIIENLSDCSLIMAVKEIPPALLLPGKTYMFFSHTIKGQSGNMQMLKTLMDRGCTLIDYEKIHDDKKRRLVFFGRYAGLAGMIDSFWALGRRLATRGFSTPFRHIRLTHEYVDLAEAKESMKQIGQQIGRPGMVPELGPSICGFAGYGHVSGGAQEIFDILPHETIEPEKIEEVAKTTGRTDRLYKVIFREEHMVERIEDRGFDLQEYYGHPERYRSRFFRYVPHLTMLINGIYWEKRYPRLISFNQLEELYREEAEPRLQVIGDISCDVEGAVQCTLRYTRPDNPVFTFDPLTGETEDGVEGRGPVVLAVDNLPCELSGEASNYFGTILLEFIYPIIRADYNVSFEDFDIPPAIKRAVIVYRGRLTPNYTYLSELVENI